MQYESVDRSQEPPEAVYLPDRNKILRPGSRFVRTRLFPNFLGDTLQVPVTEGDADILEGDDLEASRQLADDLVQPNTVAGFYHTPKGARLVGRIANRAVAIAVPNDEIHEAPAPAA